ncbi:MAG TPA: MFS transporter [Candidatus Krumholzibacteria bacterium]|nr:MFS transporter [Candidatus Krumholzibacteria bacterium]
MRRESTLQLFGSVQLVGLLGDRLKQFTLVGMLGLLVPGSSFELLKLTLFSQIPILLFTPLVGSLIDRWNKPAAIVGSCVIRALLVMCVPFAYEHTQTIYAFYVAAFVTSIFDLVFAPARSALLPEIVRPERLLSVNAMFWTLGIIGTLLGFVGGGWIFDYFSWRNSFFANAVVYAGAAVLMLPVAITHRPAETVPPLPRDPRHGIAVLARSARDAVALLRQSRELRSSLSTQSVLFAVGGVMSVIGIAHVHEVVTSGRAVVLSEVGSVLILGLITGALLAGWFREKTLPERTVSVGALLAGVAIAGMGRAESPLPMCIWAGLLGISISPVFIVTETLMQHRSPREFTGRVFAAREALIKAAFIAAAALATLVNTFVSKSSILVGLGLFLALLGVILERTQWLRLEKR